MAAPKDEQAKAEAQEVKAQEVKQSEPRPDKRTDKPEDNPANLVTKIPADPFPAYDEMELEQLRSLAQEKSVGVPADVEKAALIAKLRQVGPKATAAEVAAADGPHDVSKLGEATGEVQVTSSGDPYPSYDLMTVEELRGLLPEGEQALSDDEERGYLVGQLRAVASGPTAAQSAQVGSNRPGESLDVQSGVSDKDRGRG